MPQYSYRARTAAGQLTRGRLRAASEDSAASLLRAHQLTPVELTKVDEVALWDRTILGGNFSARDLIMFSRQMGSMIRAGVPVLEALQTLGKQDVRPVLQKLLQDLGYEIEAGGSLSVAMAKYENYFSPFMLGMVRTGEASGKLSQALLLAADYLEKDNDFVRKVRIALLYPIFIVVVVIILSLVMVAFVLPQLIELFKDAGVQLPLPTRILIYSTDFLTNYWLAIIVVVSLLGYIFLRYIRTSDGRFAVSTWVLRLPVVGRLFRKLYLARLSSILNTLFTSDVPTLDALGLAKEAMGNRVYQRILSDTVNAIKDGASISYVWEQEAEIPAMLTTMVRIGEKSGKVAEAFSEASAYFRDDVEDVLASVGVLLEPIMIIFLAFGVGIVVAAVLLPIYNLVLVL